MNKTDGGPAFPSAQPIHGARFYADIKGMSLRDWFAGQFLSTVVIVGGGDSDKIARDCYVMADAMLAERAK